MAIFQLLTITVKTAKTDHLKKKTSCPNQIWEMAPAKTLYISMFNNPDIATIVYS